MESVRDRIGIFWMDRWKVRGKEGGINFDLSWMH